MGLPQPLIFSAAKYSSVCGIGVRRSLAFHF